MRQDLARACARYNTEVMRDMWLVPCKDIELGAALHSNAAFAALKCGSARTADRVCLAAVVGAKPRHA